MALSDFLRQRRAAVKKAVGLMAENTARVAADVYAPKGANFPSKNSLAKGIVPLKPKQTGKWTECTIVSTARSRSGFDYASYQHNRTLRHVTFMPRSLSYVDFGSRGSREQRYAKGYRLASAGSPRYVSEYLYRAAAATKADNKTILQDAL